MGHRTQHSENSRWAAGIALYRKLKEYDAAGEDYHVMGHSHGGSVIYHALLHSVAKRKPFERLKSWCTVGTPFLDCRPNRFLFNRLGGVGLTIYASAIGAIALAVFLVINIMTTRYAHVFANYLIALPLLLYGFVCLLAVYACERAWGGTHPTARKNRVAERYADRWIGLWHRDDEAISALTNVRLVSAPIIPSNFLVPLISFVPVLLTITAALFAGLYPKDPASFVADLFLLPLKFLDSQTLERRQWTDERSSAAHHLQSAGSLRGARRRRVRGPHASHRCPCKTTGGARGIAALQSDQRYCLVVRQTAGVGR